MIVQDNGNIIVNNKSLIGKTILVSVAGYRYPIWSIVRSSGIANVGRRWAGCECRVCGVEMEAMV